MSSVDEKGDMFSKDDEISGIETQGGVSAEKTDGVPAITDENEQKLQKLSENEDMLLNTKSPLDDELSNDTLDEEMQLRWEDDDSTDLQGKPKDTMEVGEPPTNIADEPTVSNAELIKSDHGLNKPNVMLNIPDFQIIEAELEDFQLDHSSDIELNFEDSDNNLSELVTKVNTEIAESLSAMEETEVDGKLELSPKAEEGLLKETDDIEEQNKSESDIEIIPPNSLNNIVRPDLSKAIEKEVKVLTETLSKLEDDPVTAKPSGKNTIDIAEELLKVPKINEQDLNVKVSTLMSSIENEMLLLDAEEQVTSSTDHREDDTMEVKPTGIERREKELNLKVSSIMSSLEKEMQLLDAQEEPPTSSDLTEEEVMEVIPTGIERRKKDVDLKVSKIMSSIEKEMQLLDSQEEPAPSDLTEKRKIETIPKISFATSSLEEEMVFLDNEDKKKETTKQERSTKDVENVEHQSTHSKEKSKKKILKHSTIMSSIDKKIELLDSQENIPKPIEDEKIDPVDGVKKSYPEDVDIKVTDDSHLNDKENDESKQELKEYDEIAQAIKAIEKDNDPEDRPPMPTVVKVTEDLSEFSIIDENDEPSISLVDDDNSVEEIVQNTEPVPLSIDESEVSIIPDSDDEEPIIVADAEIETELPKSPKVLTTHDSAVEVQMIFAKEDKSLVTEPDELKMKEVKETVPQTSDNKLNQESITEEEPSSPSNAVTDKETGEEMIIEEEKPLQKEDSKGNDSISDDIANTAESQEKDLSQMGDPKPSTSAEVDLKESNDIQENSDSLGLLTESTRSMETIDDDEQDQDEQDPDDDDDDDEDFSHDDDGSNLISAEHSDDSNGRPPPIDGQKLPAPDSTRDIPVSKAKEILNIQENSVDITMSCDVSVKETDTPEDKDEEFQFPDKSDTIDPQKDGSEAMECDVLDSSIKAPKEKAEDEPTPMGTDKQSDIETVKLSDTSDTENDTATKEPAAESNVQSTKKNLAFSTIQPVVNFVDLEESSEDELSEAPKPKEDVTKTTEAPRPQVEPAPEPLQPPRPATEPAPREPTPEQPLPAVDDDVPDVEMNVEVLDEEVLNEDDEPMETTETVKSQVFNLDSDDEDKPALSEDPKPTPPEAEPTERDFRCVNSSCESDPTARCYVADASTRAFYSGGDKVRAFVCEPCLRRVETRNAELIEGIRNFTPLLELDMASCGLDLVEISDSDSDGEEALDQHFNERIGETGAKFIEENLEELLNETWNTLQMDSRLADTESVLQMEIRRIEKEAKEIKSFLDTSQQTTDEIRKELYAAFPQNIQSAPPLLIYDTPDHKYCYIQATQPATPKQKEGETPTPLNTRLSKRRMESTTAAENPAKRPAIPLGYAPLDSANAANNCEVEMKDTAVTSEATEKIDDDDNTEVSVVNIIPQEAAPPGLPPAGELVRPPLRPGMPVYAMRNAFGSWMKAYVLEVLPRGTHSNFTSCKIRFDSRNSKQTVLTARCLAYAQPATARMTIGTRVIALFKDKDSALKRESYYSGIVAEVPNPVNKYRYLVFFDDGYAQYASHADTRLVCEFSDLVWEEVHPFSRDFVRRYLLAYPERPMVRLHPFQSLKTEWNGKWWTSRVVTVDASLAQVHFPTHGRYEWIYRGSTRLAPLYLELQAAERTRPRALPRTQAHSRSNMPVVEYTRDEQTNKPTDSQKSDSPQHQRTQSAESEVNRRAVAKKSTSVVAHTTHTPHTPQPPAPRPPAAAAAAANLDNVTSRVVYYTPKNAVKPHKFAPHACGPQCRRSDVLSLKELRTYNPLAKPLLSGWERQIVRFKGQKAVAYRAPCGRRVRDVRELHRYLRAVRCDLPVDLFDFAPHTHCLAEFVLNKCLIMKKDLSQGKENVPVPCVNYYDQTLPEFCSYNTERTPTAGVPLNLDPEFLCGCDCEDDCEDKTKCACWKLTLEGARTIGLEGDSVGYVYKRLPEPLPSGIYECNSRCKCKHTCLNRVAQHPLQLKLQVFKTLNRGWGIRALNDVPKGSFLCVYAGNLLTDATANLDGLNEGDEYLAELDYIEVVEQMKEGYEEDIPAAIKKLDLQDKKIVTESEDEMSSEEESQAPSKNEREDDDFRPGYIGLRVSEFNKRLRKRKTKDTDNAAEERTEVEREKDKEKEKEKEEQKKEEKGSNEDDCITISDDDEVREPSSFAAAAGMGANQFVSKYKSVRSLFGEDESCYIMDAKVQGNIGRYLNHSCSPNVFVQNVFVDTHDPRFPWVAFFALSHVRAGTELTWNYNYDVGSVPGKALYCYCGAPNCRGRLL